jgi:hypothetical protein
LIALPSSYSADFFVLKFFRVNTNDIEIQKSDRNEQANTDDDDNEMYVNKVHPSYTPPNTDTWPIKCYWEWDHFKKSISPFVLFFIIIIIFISARKLCFCGFLVKKTRKLGGGLNS